MADTSSFNTAIQFAISTGKIQSASEIDLSKSTAGITAALSAVVVTVAKSVAVGTAVSCLRRSIWFS